LAEQLAKAITKHGFPPAPRVYRRNIARCIALAASQTARLFNAADLASPFSISRPTIREYLALLEQIFLIEQLEPWHSNRKVGYIIDF
jgi:predicted AAA+ superfamily ATPase